ncbi:MAG: hypothetical protein ABSG90_11790 [Dehalococcoidia bacterium]|jgi:hypothetical protein
MAGGKGAYCKSCGRRYQVEHKSKNPDLQKKQRTYFNNYYQTRNTEIQIERRKKREANHLLKKLQDKAWLEFKNALRTGLVKGPPLLCNGCWDVFKIGQQYESHHPNYNEPLIVIWLCKSCHRRLHRYGLDGRFK